MRNRLPIRLLLTLGALYAALACGAGATAQAGGAQRPVHFDRTASPGLIDGAPAPGQILLRGGGRHSCQSLHVDFDAGGQAQSAALVLKREGRPDVWVDTQTDTRGRLDAALRPGRAWQLAASTPSVSIAVEASGWAACRSGRGLR